MRAQLASSPTHQIIYRVFAFISGILKWLNKVRNIIPEASDIGNDYGKTYSRQSDSRPNE
jgi:hypothetical protein